MSNSGPGDDLLRQELQRHDRDRYLATLLADSGRMPALWALLGFNLEIAKVRESVREPILGQIRLQWWRDALEEIYSGQPVRRHVVATPLADAVRHYGIARAHLDGMIDGRERDLDDQPPATLEALTAYAEATSSRLLYAQCEVLGRPAHEAGFEAARRIGIAWALTGLLRAIPFHAHAHRIYIPSDIAQAVDLHEHDVYAARPLPQLSAAAALLADAARGHLAAGRALRREVPARQLPVFLPARVAAHYLKRLAASGHDPHAPIVQMADPLASLRMGWGRVTGRY